MKKQTLPGWLRPGFGNESGADFDADDLFALVMSTLRAGAVALVAQMVALRAVVNCGAWNLLLLARRFRTRLLDDLIFGTAIKLLPY